MPRVLLRVNFMPKPKREVPLPEMRDRLAVNRSGKLSPAQWVDIVIQPLMTLLVLMLPAAVVFWSRLVVLYRPGLMMLAFVTVILGITVFFRALRYARAPVHCATLCAEADAPPFWMFWKPITLYSEDGKTLHFKKRLCPPPLIKRDVCYVVYFLREPQEDILLSITPADHPEVENWVPDKQFQARFESRSVRS